MYLEAKLLLFERSAMRLRVRSLPLPRQTGEDDGRREATKMCPSCRQLDEPWSWRVEGLRFVRLRARRFGGAAVLLVC